MITKIVIEIEEGAIIFDFHFGERDRHLFKIEQCPLSAIGEELTLTRDHAIEQHKECTNVD